MSNSNFQILDFASNQILNNAIFNNLKSTFIYQSCSNIYFWNIICICIFILRSSKYIIHLDDSKKNLDKKKYDIWNNIELLK